MSDYCELNDMPASMCAHCRGLTLDGKPTEFDVARRFTALYDGRCAACNHAFSEGDRIAKTADSEYICGSCADKAVQP